MDIWNIEGLAVGKRLILNLPGQRGATEYHSITLIEGWSKEYNYIYGRVLSGQEIGTDISGVIGWGAVCIRHSDLKGFEIECR